MAIAKGQDTIVLVKFRRNTNQAGYIVNGLSKDMTNDTITKGVAQSATTNQLKCH